jgi:hypothetical protein
MTRLLAPLLMRIAELLDRSLYTVPDMEAPMPPRPANTGPFTIGKALR